MRVDLSVDRSSVSGTTGKEGLVSVKPRADVGADEDNGDGEEEDDVDDLCIASSMDLSSVLLSEFE